MKVKFTEPVLNRVEFGTIIEMFNAEMFVIQGDKGGRFIINPNSDCNFGFIWDEEAERNYAEALDRHAEEMEQLDKQARRSK